MTRTKVYIPFSTNRLRITQNISLDVTEQVLWFIVFLHLRKFVQRSLDGPKSFLLP